MLRERHAPLLRGTASVAISGEDDQLRLGRSLLCNSGLLAAAANVRIMHVIF